MKFEELQLKPELLKAVLEAGYASTFPIQERAIPPALERKDVIGRAHSGSGKTATFLIPILQHLYPKGLQALILAPTRELAIQITEEAEKLGKYLNVKALTVYGGRSIDEQARKIPGAQIIVGTPGRIIDHIQRGNLRLSTIRMLVLDEADRMLDMGFIEDTEWIIQKTPRERQTMLFSATMPDEIKRIVSRYMRNPVVIELNVERPAVSTVKQSIWFVHQDQRVVALKYALNTIKPQLGIVFVATKRGADRLMRELVRNYHVDVIHGDLSQSQRERVLERFRNGDINLLIATDVAARGIDVENVSHVFNFDMPNDVETYIHRIGRSGRAGKSGMAITFATEAEATDIGRIEFIVKTHIEKVRFAQGNLLPVNPEEFGSHRAIVPVWTRRERGRGRMGGPMHRGRPMGRPGGRRFRRR